MIVISTEGLPTDKVILIKIVGIEVMLDVLYSNQLKILESLGHDKEAVDEECGEKLRERVSDFMASLKVD